MLDYIAGDIQERSRHWSLSSSLHSPTLLRLNFDGGLLPVFSLLLLFFFFIRKFLYTHSCVWPLIVRHAQQTGAGLMHFVWILRDGGLPIAGVDLVGNDVDVVGVGVVCRRLTWENRMGATRNRCRGPRSA